MKTSFSPIILAFGISAAIVPVAFSDEKARFAIIQFEGTSQLPHANQASVIDMPQKNRSSNSSSEISESPLHYIVIADTSKNQLYIYAKMSLWRMDTRTLDQEAEYLWHQTTNGVTECSDDHKIALPQEMLWYVALRSVFVDVFELPIDESLKELIDKIESQVESPSFGTSSQRNLLAPMADVLNQRSIDETGRKLVVNNYTKGKILSAVSAATIDGQKRTLSCKSIDYLNEKPVEIRTGLLSLSSASELPSQVSQILTRYGFSDAEVVSTGTQSKQGLENAGQTRRVKPERTRSQSGWPLIVLYLGTIAFLFVMGFRVFHGLKRR